LTRTTLPYFANTLSELCVPLLDKDGEDGGVIGVLNVESREKSFTQRDLQKLEILADLAVIAIQNAESKKKLVKMEMMATLGELTSQLLHRMNNDVGASKVLIREAIGSLSSEDIETVRGKVNQVMRLINRISHNLGGLRTWRQEPPQLINLTQMVSIALAQVQVPVEATLKIGILSQGFQR
jgi:C4-dicarboxylate-specific signal transduction histidine kinase